MFRDQGIQHWITPAADIDSSCFVAKIAGADASEKETRVPIRDRAGTDLKGEFLPKRLAMS